MSQPEQNIEPEMVDERQQVIQIEDDGEQFSDDFHSDEENRPQIDQEALKEVQSIPKVTNPVSAYSVFMKDYRDQHPRQKFNMSAIGQLWKQLDAQDKQIYEKKFVVQKQKYEEYEAQMLAIDPNWGKKNKSSKSYFFPLHRIRAIMKQDSDIATTNDNIPAMANAVEYFGEYLLEEVKKTTKDKKRIELGDLFEAINNNQNNLWFLNCLIDEYNLENQHHKSTAVPNSEIKKSKPVPTPSVNIHQLDHEKLNKIEKPPKQSQSQKKSKTQIPKNQMKLTDMF